MGVISIGASLGVTEKAAARIPSVSPSASSAAAALNVGSTAAAPSATGGPRRQEFTSHHHHTNGNGGAQQQPQPGRNKRGGRRKYVPNNQAIPGVVFPSNTAANVAQPTHPSSFPVPPPIVTDRSSISAMSATAAAPTKVYPGRSSSSMASAAHTNGLPNASSTVTTPLPSPSRIVRIVSFHTNVEPHLIVPFVHGAKGGSRLNVFMAQSKCSIAARDGNQDDTATTVIHINKSNSSHNSTTTTASTRQGDWKLGFTIAGDTVKRVDYAQRLLQGAVETAEQILERRKVAAQPAVVAVVAGAVTAAVDSGGNSKPSSSHASVSSAAMQTDHSIDTLPPPPPLPRVSTSLSRLSSLSSLSSSSHHIDERKAQTRIRSPPPTNQPLQRGPGLAPSRRSDESARATMTMAATKARYEPTAAKMTGKKRHLPSSSVETNRGIDTRKRERIAPPGQSLPQQKAPHETAESEEPMHGIVENGQGERERSVPGQEDAETHRDATTATPSDVDHAAAAEASAAAASAEFDEFRIRLTRGIEFARQVDAQAQHVKRKMELEKIKYLRMKEQAQAMQHQQRVADIVIRTQCAIMATSESNGKKRRRIEQLSTAQDAMRQSTPTAQSKRKAVGARPLDLYHEQQQQRRLTAAAEATPASRAFTDLLKKMAAFRALVAKKQPTPPAVPSAGEEAIARSPPATEKENAEEEKDQSPCHVAQPEPATSSSPPPPPPPQSVDVPSSCFRSRYLAPGLPCDLNLIQDYTDESECGILRLLIGQRQYFYLQPISLSYGIHDGDQIDLDKFIQNALRSHHDLQVLYDFVIKNKRYGADLITQLEAIALPTTSSSKARSSSTAACWTAMQRMLVDLHPLVLALHLLALHFHAVSVLQREKKGFVDASQDNLFGRDEETQTALSTDLFKFVLRPIRSSAIESSLHDALPISLVRETIAHCPEVVNHVLDWKEQDDVPPRLLEDVLAPRSNSHNAKKNSVASSSSSSVGLLGEILFKLRRHAKDFDRSMRELGLFLQSGNPARHTNGDKVICLVNQLKSISAHIVVMNTQLQLHKWTTIFVEKGFSWFDEDDDDDDGDDYDADEAMRATGGGGRGGRRSGGDRSYDKFTCLQDALYVWHKARVAYSAKDEEDHEAYPMEETTATRMGVEPEREQEPEMAAPQDLEPPELVELRRISPPEVAAIVETQFTSRQAVMSHFLTNSAIASVRNELNASLTAMRASIKVLGRSAPWRTHVKHSNALKKEYATQKALENKLLLHQWATYYKQNRNDLPALGDEEKDTTNAQDDEMVDAAAAAIAAAEPPQREMEAETPGKTVAFGESVVDNAESKNSSEGIEIAPGDTTEIVEMKMLRHEIECVAKQMHNLSSSATLTTAASASATSKKTKKKQNKKKKASSGHDDDEDRDDDDDDSGDRESGGGSVTSDRQRLLDACNLLATSCVTALTRFLDPTAASVPPVAIAAGANADAPPAIGNRCQRANSTSKVDSLSRDRGSQRKPSQRKLSSCHVDEALNSSPHEAASAMKTVGATATPERKSQSTSKSTKAASAASSTPAKKETTRRLRAHSTSSASPRLPPAPSPASPSSPPTIMPAAVPSRTTKTPAAESAEMPSAVAVSSSSPVATAEPLRMGCSGCRDTRRRCTGCHGCCLHCVCVGCGCRMCCSTRFTVVQKTLSLLVTAVETRMGCKWIELDAIASHHGPSARCGMVKACGACQQCAAHCDCHHVHSSSSHFVPGSLPSSSSHRTSAGAGYLHTTAGFPLGSSASSRKERRFRINLTAAQRRQTQHATSTDHDTEDQGELHDDNTGDEPNGGATAPPPPASAKRTRRRSNSDVSAARHPSESAEAAASCSSSSDFVFSSTDGLSCSSSTDGLNNPQQQNFSGPSTAYTIPTPQHHKSEQEDLFRAARVRMKLQRNTLFSSAAGATGSSATPFGLIPPNTLIESELLWHPERIKLMWERKDVYGVLGVPRDATPHLIKRQYRKLVLKLHPDKAGPGAAAPENQTQSQAPMASHHQQQAPAAAAADVHARVTAFVAVTKAYKLLAGEIGVIHNTAWKTTK